MPSSTTVEIVVLLQDRSSQQPLRAFDIWLRYFFSLSASGDLTDGLRATRKPPPSERDV